MDYASLVAVVPGYVARSGDTALIALIPTFIALFEAKANRRLRARPMVTRTTISPSSETLAVPDDFAGLKHLSAIDDPNGNIEPVSSERLTELQADTDADGDIRYVAVEGESFVFWPAPSEAVDLKLVYYARVPALTEADDTNWLIEKHPDAYLYGVALEAALYLIDPEQIERFAALLTTAVEDINASYSREAPDRLTPQGVSVV